MAVLRPSVGSISERPVSCRMPLALRHSDDLGVWQQPNSPVSFLGEEIAERFPPGPLKNVS